MRAAAALEGARAAYGLVQLGRPGLMAKLLGARLLVQSTLTLLGSSDTDEDAARVLHELGGVVDALHSVSMVGMAAVSERHRSEAIRQAVVAGCFAAGEALVGRARW